MLHLSKLVPVNVRSQLVTLLCRLSAGAIAAVVVSNVPMSNMLLVLACPFSHLLLGHGRRKYEAGGSSHAPVSSTAPAMQGGVSQVSRQEPMISLDWE